MIFKRCFYFAGVASVALVIWICFGLFSPTQAQAEITINPTQITIASVWGATETRSLVLHSVTALTNLKVTPTGLFRDDGGAALPASSIQVQAPTQVAANEPATLNLNVALGNVSSGKLTGTLLVTYDG